MINGKDQEIITINKTGNSILNNAKYSADKRAVTVKNAKIGFILFDEK